MTALIKAECEAATSQCKHGPESESNLFIEEIIGNEMIHAGAYVMLIGEYLECLSSSENVNLEYVKVCVQVIKHSAPAVFSLLLHDSSEATTSHLDPRPTFAEAWFLTMKTLAAVCRHDEKIISSLASENIPALFGDSLSLAMLFIFMKDLGGKNRPPPEIQRGMSPDGPHVLAMCDFISESLILGPSVLSAVARSISTHIQFNFCNEVTAEVLGAAAISSALLRAISGAAPPWVVEDTPILFRSIFTALDGDLDLFIQTLNVSTKLETLTVFGALRAGEKLSGRYLDASVSHVDAFLSKARESCSKNDWKKIKVILKSATGGKKKESGFNLKPHYSSWECERV